MAVNGQQPSGAPAALATGIAPAAGSVKAAMLWLLLATSAVVLVAAVWLLISKQQANDRIRSLRAGKDVPVDVGSAPAALLEARAGFLLTRDRIDEAQPLLDEVSLRGSEPQRGRLLYNMANARIRAAVTAIEQGKFDKAIPLVSLAKAEYRSALRIDPENWNAKHNLDAAMRLVRDLPQGEGEEGDKPAEVPAKLWTDLPGVPKGLP